MPFPPRHTPPTVHLRNLVEADLPTLYTYRLDPVAARMAAVAPRDRDAYMTQWRDHVIGNPRCVKQAVIVDGALAGHINSWTPDAPAAASAASAASAAPAVSVAPAAAAATPLRLVGYWLDAAVWGRGVATAALAAFLRDHEPLRPLHAFVALSNVASTRVLEKCGFRRIGEPTAADDGVIELLLRLDDAAPR